MKHLIYAMDTHFMCDNQGPNPEEQVALVKAAGFNGYYFTDWMEKQESFRAVRDATLEAGLTFAASLTPFEVEKAPTDQDLKQLDAALAEFPKDTLVEITVLWQGFGNHVGDPAVDGKALAWLRPLEPLLEKHGLRACLYPHFGFAMETFSDALRLLGPLASKRFGVIFTAYHWYRVGKETSLADLFAQAGDRLFSVNLCGSRYWEREEEVVNGLNPSIEPLDAGTLDNLAILDELAKTGFEGPIGVQGYGVNASATKALQRSKHWLDQRRGRDLKVGE